MKTPGRTFLYIFLSILLCLIFFIFRSFFYDNVVDPIAHFFWLIVRSILSIDQEVVWAIFLLAVSIVVLLTFPKDKQTRFRSSYLYTNKAEDRCSCWKMRFQSAEKHAYARDSLQQNLEELADSIEEVLGKNGEYEISVPTLKTKTWNSHLVKLINIFKKKSSNDRRFLDKDLVRDVTHFLDSMESLLEKQNDQSSNNPNKR